MANDRGVFAIDRALYHGPHAHPFFKDEPFTEREAWVWMIGEAAFEPYQRRVGRAVYDLKRGQFVAASRFIAVKWQWTESRVRRFLERLQSCSMIVAAPTREATLISICNYDDYQFQRRAGDAPATRPRREEEELEEVKKEDGGDARARASHCAISSEAFAFADELAVLCGQDLGFLTPQWINGQAPLRVQMMLNAGWTVPIMRDAAVAAVRGKRDGPPQSVRYFDKIFARAHSPQLPLPPVQVVSSTENSHASAHSDGRPAASWQRAKDDFRDAHRNLKAAVAGAGEAAQPGTDGDGKVIRFVAST